MRSIPLGRAGILLGMLAALSPDPAYAQLESLKRKLKEAARTELESGPGLAQLLEREPLTTNLDDALPEARELDEFEPIGYTPMEEMPRGLNGSFFLVPGTYSFEGESYCLKAGTWGPSNGDGYLVAPLKGPKADIIRAILERSWLHPQLEQQEIQRLLWAIIARQRVSEADGQVRMTAARILTPEELARLEVDVADIVQPAVLDRLLGEVPAPMRRALEAENDLRRLLSDPGRTFEELERAAVLTGLPPMDEAGRHLPEGRWSKHPDGYFIRFRSRYYGTTRTDIYYPGEHTVERDLQGRIGSIADPGGRRVELAYGSVSFAAVSGRYPRSFALEEVRLVLGQRVVERLRMPETARVVVQAEPSIGSRDVVELEALLHVLQDLRTSSSNRGLVAIKEVALGAYHDAVLNHPRGSSDGPRVTATRRRQLQQYSPPDRAAQPAGPRQRLGQSGRASGDRDFQITQQARDYIGGVSNALDAVTLGSGGLGDFIGGFGPSQVLGWGLGWALDSADEIGRALGGDPGGGGDEEDRDDGVQLRPDESPVSWDRGLLVGSDNPERASARGPAPSADRETDRFLPQEDYRRFSMPRFYEPPRVEGAQGISAERVGAANDLLAAALRLHAFVQALLVTRDRFAAASRASDQVWQESHAVGLIHLKRETGLAMQELALRIESLTALVGREEGGALEVTIDELERAQVRLRSEGLPAEAIEFARFMDVPRERQEHRRERAIAVDAAAIAGDPFQLLLEAAFVLREYGSRLASIPAVASPWDGEEWIRPLGHEISGTSLGGWRRTVPQS